MSRIIIIISLSLLLSSCKQPQLFDTQSLNSSYEQLKLKPKLEQITCPKEYNMSHIECASLTVPSDYKYDSGLYFDLSVVRFKALNPSQRIGTIFFSVGGPAKADAWFLADQMLFYHYFIIY